jgi:hypothetical protein
MSTTRDGKAALVDARDALGREHDAIRRMLEGLRVEIAAAADARPLLSELHKALAKHFAHETYPGGFYDLLGSAAPSLGGEARALVDEHLVLLASTQALRERAERGEPAGQQFAGEIDALLARLADHERRETRLVESALAS